MFLVFFSGIYMLLVSRQIVHHNSLFIFLVIGGCFVLANVFLSRRYRKENYISIILKFDEQAAYSKLKICVLFFVFLLVPLLLLGVGVIFLRKWLY
jgi:hypothetical protein